MMKRFYFFCLAIFSLSTQAAAETLKPFTSDGCSGFFNGTLEHSKLWLDCCTTHDYAYWKGGSYQERVEADKALQRCVAEAGEKEIALVMLAGVRIGGSPVLPTGFRWGYGWPFPRSYGLLTEQELEEIKSLEEAGEKLSIEFD